MVIVWHHVAAVAIVILQNNFPNINQDAPFGNLKDSKKNIKKSRFKNKGINRNIIAQNRIGRQQLVSADNSFAN